MGFEKLGDITSRIVSQLGPVEYTVPLHGPVAVRLEEYAKGQHSKPETIIAEAVRVYMGDAA